MSKARPLKKRLIELERQATDCADPAQREILSEKANRLRRDLEQAGYLTPLVKSPKRKLVSSGKKGKKPQGVDVLVRARTRTGFAGRVRIVQGGAVRGK